MYSSKSTNSAKDPQWRWKCLRHDDQDSIITDSFCITRSTYQCFTHGTGDNGAKSAQNCRKRDLNRVSFTIHQENSTGESPKK